MAGLINKINRSLISPLPIVYSSALKQIIKTMLRKSPEHRPTAAELLRHPHLQPFLLRCHNPSAVFLPVKSPSPKKTKEKSSPRSSSGGRKDPRARELKVMKQRELLPLFDENADMAYPSGEDTLVEYKLETKRVDPTSYSGKISHDSEDSKSCEASGCCIVDDVEMPAGDSPAANEEVDESEKIEEAERNGCIDGGVSVAQETAAADETVCGDVAVEAEAEASSKSEEGVIEGAVPRRADALESLLELCAHLLKQDKFEELTGVLKPFGEDTVSSRETAIWLTKSLINLPNDS